MQALANRSSSINCSPPPDWVLGTLFVPHVVLLRRTVFCYIFVHGHLFGHLFWVQKLGMSKREFRIRSRNRGVSRPQHAIRNFKASEPRTLCQIVISETSCVAVYLHLRARAHLVRAWEGGRTSRRRCRCFVRPRPAPATRACLN